MNVIVTAWNKISADGSETKMVAGNGITLTGSGTIADPYHYQYYYSL